ncbi:MAG: LacI family DNA-binding transcriptional regulator [Candidatus Promineifilaceae bacterium]
MDEISNSSSLTLEDIADLAGVSRSTVSRVINNHPSVSEVVRHRVWEIVEETGYRPHPAARSLASQRTSIIGLVIPRRVHTFFTDPYFPRLTEGIAQACNEHRYMLSLFLFYTEEDERNLFPTISRPGLVDGLIIQSTHAADEMFVQLNESVVPTIVVGRPMQVSDLSYVDVDNVSGAFTAVRHLFHLGRRRISTITGPLDTTVGLDRYEGYQKALSESRLPFDRRLCSEGDLSESSGYYSAQRLLPLKPDALFVASDIMAVGALRAIREKGLNIPEDIAIVSFDDLPPATRTTPPLTTVRQPIRRLGIELVNSLLDIIQNGPLPPRRVVFGTELVIRESCGANLATR